MLCYYITPFDHFHRTLGPTLNLILKACLKVHRDLRPMRHLIGVMRRHFQKNLKVNFPKVYFVKVCVFIKCHHLIPVLVQYILANLHLVVCWVSWLCCFYPSAGWPLGPLRPVRPFGPKGPAGALRHSLLHQNGNFVPPAQWIQTRRRVKMGFRRKTGRGQAVYQSIRKVPTGETTKISAVSPVGAFRIDS